MSNSVIPFRTDVIITKHDCDVDNYPQQIIQSEIWLIYLTKCKNEKLFIIQIVATKKQRNVSIHV